MSKARDINPHGDPTPGAKGGVRRVARFSAAQSAPEALKDAEPFAKRCQVAPGQVWNDDSVRRAGGPVLAISLDSGYAYCRDGRDGDGRPRRIALAWFDERRRGGLSLVSGDDGLEDLVERRALSALWELDYLGRPATTETICGLLGGFYPLWRVETALADAEAEGLALRAEEAEDHWRLTGGGRRIAAAA